MDDGFSGLEGHATAYILIRIRARANAIVRIMAEMGADAVTIRPARVVAGRVRVPGDKSISHRYALLAALAEGSSTIDGYSAGADCAAMTEKVLQLILIRGFPI